MQGKFGGYAGKMGDTFSSLRDGVSSPRSKTEEPHKGGTSQNNPKDGSGSNDVKQQFNQDGQDTPPKQNQTGSNPSHTNNSTTYPNTAQDNLAKAQQNLAELKAMSPLDSAKNAIKLMAGTSVNPDSAEYKSFASKVDHNIPINAMDLKNVGLSTQDVQKAGFSMDYSKNPKGTVNLAESLSQKKHSLGTLDINKMDPLPRLTVRERGHAPREGALFC